MSTISHPRCGPRGRRCEMRVSLPCAEQFHLLNVQLSPVPLGTDGIDFFFFLASLSTLASFALTTCYTNQLRMSRSHLNKSNSIRSRRPLAHSPSKLPGCIGWSHCRHFRGVIRITRLI
jgi:hypothetical protein